MRKLSRIQQKIYQAKDKPLALLEKAILCKLYKANTFQVDSLEEELKEIRQARYELYWLII